MFSVISKTTLCPGMIKLTVDAPHIARKAKAGQFVIIRTNENSERIPLTIAGCDGNGVTVIFQEVGFSTMELAKVEPGDCLCDFTGPLGRPTEVEGFKKAAVIGGGTGVAIALPLAKALSENGTEVHSVVGFRNKELIILKEEFEAASDRIILMTDDGTAGRKGLVTEGLGDLLTENRYDVVFVIGPLPMMRAVCALTREYGIKTIVSMNSIMIDGTGMCGCCRITVGGEMKFACVDGPDFDGHLVDFDEAIQRGRTYRTFEQEAKEHGCNLLKGANPNA